MISIDGVVDCERRLAESEQIAVRPSRSGDGWEVVPEGHRRGLVRRDTEGAIALARERLGERSGGQVVVLNRTGKVTESIWIGPELSGGEGEQMNVVHCERGHYDVYIGEGCCPETGEPSCWANPFPIDPDASREQVIDRYADWLGEELAQGRIHLRDLAALDGKVLGCRCAPEACHGEVLVAAASWAQDELICRPRCEPPNQSWCVGCSVDGKDGTQACSGCGIPRF